MHLLSLLMLGSGLAAAQLDVATDHKNMQIKCDSVGLNNGDRGIKEWRASTKDCSAATNALEAHFEDNQNTAVSNPGCLEVASAGDCAVSICDVSSIHKEIKYYELWAAARLIHARHKSNGNVAGYVEIVDVDGFKGHVKVGKKGTPSPVTNRKRGIAGRRSEKAASFHPGSVTSSSHLAPRANDDDHYVNMTEIDIDGTSFRTDIRAAWGESAFVAEDQMQHPEEYLLNDWEANPNAQDIQPEAYVAPSFIGGTFIEMELAAHNNHNLGAIGNRENLKNAIRFAVHQRAIIGGHGNFIMQIRNAGQSIAHLIIRVWDRRNGRPDVCRPRRN